MDVSTAGALAAFTYRSALQSGTPAQAIQQAFLAAASAGAQTTQLAGSGSDATLLNLSTQPPTSLGTYQVSAQAGVGSAAIQSLITATPSADMLLAAGMNAGSQSFPLTDPNVTAAWSGFQYALAVGSGQTPAGYAQQATVASAIQSTGTLNLLA
jgi:hypothetical protein